MPCRSRTPVALLRAACWPCGRTAVAQPRDCVAPSLPRTRPAWLTGRPARSRASSARPGRHARLHSRCFAISSTHTGDPRTSAARAHPRTPRGGHLRDAVATRTRRPHPAAQVLLNRGTSGPAGRKRARHAALHCPRTPATTRTLRRRPSPAYAGPPLAARSVRPPGRDSGRCEMEHWSPRRTENARLHLCADAARRGEACPGSLAPQRPAA